MVVKDSEEYYRTMIDAGTKSWNLRDSHMLRMLEALIKYLEPQRPTIVTSETHKGKLRKEWNIGQLARKQFGMDKGYNIGFTTYNGSVRIKLFGFLIQLIHRASKHMNTYFIWFLKNHHH
ncbi:hypothetical protein GLOIN_2v1488844 [Rhizophagus irregularis DAOM 181602=DAOM 197198]|uniref:Uncharacterized protein n=1 Tax=Rhizophagus irregularis (strain DAOM 181602 / DAOM 197198 / MUCL 43194) TaxID=747089 RepID=A0A2P4NYD5_RHIID|nr:hypothetical protein GLOIN_2v1488844 [Rhizophagus irregularis DAOM 181602=DAOM 197198]POG58127.1 hypothetical protein GLOIN_2v1488844 [Rhizophagus irregularis DAOM 181602=DAOM 197198]|eukprot:XP_025164993.1 hypothetical protein GLOIN_2v1488844 [Rhizophagus irregularis DAOM 181602=DAOM 197198]